MTNISLNPGTWNYDDLIADTDDAILMETNRSWSIDDRRYQFQFSTEIGWEIKGGKKSAHAEKSQLQRHHHGVLELAATRSVHAITGRSGARRTAAKASPCKPWAPATARRHRAFAT